MRMCSSTRRLGGWLALWALAFAALAPALSTLLREAATPAWFEVCTPAGARFVAAEGDATHPAKRPGAMPLDDCPYCAWQHAFVALPVTAPLLSLLPPSSGPPERFLSALRTPFAWTAARPRGPPLPN